MIFKRTICAAAVSALLAQSAALTAFASYGFDEASGTYSWDFSDRVTETVSEAQTVDYEGLKIHLQQGDSINAVDGVVFAQNGEQGTRCVEYTPEYDGVMNVVYYMNNNASKYMYSYIYDRTAGEIVTQTTTGGRVDAELSAVCAAGHTYYMYSTGNGNNNYG